MPRCLVNLISTSQAYAMRTALRVLTFSLCLGGVHCFPHILLSLSYKMIWLHIFESNENFGMTLTLTKKKRMCEQTIGLLIMMLLGSGVEWIYFVVYTLQCNSYLFMKRSRLSRVKLIFNS